MRRVMDGRVVLLCVMAGGLAAGLPITPCTPYTAAEMHDLCNNCPPLNPSMYFPNPCDSCDYMQCYKLVTGQWSMQQMNCPPCQCMNFDKLTCEPSDDHDDEVCTTPPPVTEQVLGNDRTCVVIGPNGAYSQTFGVVAGSPNKYLWIMDTSTVEMTCAPGTFFNVSSCRCERDPKYTSKKRPIMCLDFNDVKNPYKTRTGVSVSPIDVKIIGGGVTGKCAYFNGQSSWISVPFFNNWQGKVLSISVWVRRIVPAVGTVSDYQAVMSNKDCAAGGENASIQIRSDAVPGVGATVGGGFRTVYDDELDAFDGISASGWAHVVLKYNGAEISMYVNGVKVTPDVAASGHTERVHCPLLIGAEYLSHYFNGFLDEMCFYDYDLSSAQITNLYTSELALNFP